MTLQSADLRVEIDPEFGAEVRSIVAKRADCELLMHTPWRETALRQRRPGLTFPVSASEPGWMERYGGGWQVLFPHAGLVEEVQGSERSYHGEASVVHWAIEEQGEAELVATTRLFSVPVTMRRRFTLDGGSLSLTDTLLNESDQEILFDYAHHPAFGAPFIERGCVIETGARRYVPDPRGFLGEFEPAAPIDWPSGVTRDGEAIRLDVMVGEGARKARFGWLQDFAEPWATVRNPRLDVGVRLSWTAPELRYAWFWLEAGANRNPPWFGRGYTLAIEPASTPPAGDQKQRLALAPHQQREFRLRLELLRGAVPPQDKQPQ